MVPSLSHAHVKPFAWQFVVLGLLIAGGCDFRGCSGQEYTLMYQGPGIDPQAAVWIDDRPIGYIVANSPDMGVQQLRIAVRDVAEVHNRDVYLPQKTDSGQTGLRIRHVGGDSLFAGAVVYYPPREGPQGPVYSERQDREAPGRAPTETPADIVVETPDGMPDPALTIGSASDTVERQTARRALATIHDLPYLPEKSVRRLSSLQALTIKPGNDVEIIRELKKNIPELRESLGRDAREAHQRGDSREASHALQAMQKVIMLERRMEDLERSALMRAAQGH